LTAFAPSLCFANSLEVLTDAQLDSIEAASVQLNTVVVTGTRTPKLLKNSPILTRVITENDIRKVDATNISDLLQSELPGIEFTYSMNQQVSLNMQGFGGNSVLFLVESRL
jgi:outer membrane receptor for ferrienterochelin and colicins